MRMRRAVCARRAEAKLQALWVIRRVLFEIVERCGFIDSVTQTVARWSLPYLMENKQQLVWESAEFWAQGASGVIL